MEPLKRILADKRVKYALFAMLAILLVGVGLSKLKQKSAEAPAAAEVPAAAAK